MSRPMSERGEKPVNLPLMDGERSLCPDDVIGAGDFFLNGHLGGDALPDLFRRPAARQKPFLPGGVGTGDADDLVEVRFRLRFKQQWNDDKARRKLFPAHAVASFWLGTPGFNLSEPLFADGRVEDGFQFFAGIRVRKNDPGKLIAFQFASLSNDGFAEGGLDFVEGRPAGLDELPGKLVGVHDLRAAFAEKIGGGGFAHAHAAGQAANFHDSNGRHIHCTAR